MVMLCLTSNNIDDVVARIAEEILTVTNTKSIYICETKNRKDYSQNIDQQYEQLMQQMIRL